MPPYWCATKPPCAQSKTVGPVARRTAQKIRRSLAELETDAIAELTSHFDIAAISVACALGYLDFRHPDLQWRVDNPQLAAWYADVSQRPSMLETQPPA